MTEAYAVGGAAAAAAFAGETGKMIALKRVSEYPYQCITEAVDVQQVANLEKKVPLDWITPDGMQVTAAFEEYARPLILDEVTPSTSTVRPATSACNRFSPSPRLFSCSCTI